MNELLDLAVKAHGGIQRWDKVKSIKVAGSIRRVGVTIAFFAIAIGYVRFCDRIR
jgi:hypothetical protein